jgi:hypothetical protein
VEVVDNGEVNTVVSWYEGVQRRTRQTRGQVSASATYSDHTPICPPRPFTGFGD